MRRLVSLVLLLLITINASVQAAAGDTKTGAITISPFQQQINIDAGARQPNFAVTVTNHTNSIYSFRVKPVDFGSLNDTGGILFAGAQGTDFTKRYGLTKWLVVDNPNQSLAGGQSVQIGFHIDNRQDLSPGGHYAALILTDIAQGKKPVAASVGFQSNISSLIFATKRTGAQESLQLLSIANDRHLLTTPAHIKLRFKSNGNVHAIPRGEVKITGPFGKSIGRGIINEASEIILPGTVRVIEVPIIATGSALLPGNYKTEVSYRDDSGTTYQKSSEKFFYFGWPLLIVLLVLLGWAGRRAYLAR